MAENACVQRVEVSKENTTEETRHKTTKMLWMKFREKNSEAQRNVLMEKYLPLVRIIAEKVAAKLPSSVDAHDLQSACVV